VDTELQEYRKYLIEKHNAEFPEFAKDAVHTAPVLVLLQDPGNSGAEDSRACSIDNDDQTSRNQRMAIDSSGIDTADIVFWNFFASFDIGKNFGIESQEEWAEEVEKLIGDMPKLEVVLVCGEKAWKGMRFVKLDKNIALIAAPHPSGRGLSQPKAEKRLKDAWKQARDIIK
jgi:hypothetical protein|tara:strand:+ start:132 stop:647 length:516 start_codon:yes stop_codon:yes gene_type:complete